MSVVKIIEKLVTEQDKIIAFNEKTIDILETYDKRLSIVENRLNKLLKKK